MYALLLKYLPAPAANAIVVVVQTTAIIVVVLLADKPFGQFAYLKM